MTRVTLLQILIFKLTLITKDLGLEMKKKAKKEENSIKVFVEKFLRII